MSYISVYAKLEIRILISLWLVTVVVVLCTHALQTNNGAKKRRRIHHGVFDFVLLKKAITRPTIIIVRRGRVAGVRGESRYEPEKEDEEET